MEPESTVTEITDTDLESDLTVDSVQHMSEEQFETYLEKMEEINVSNMEVNEQNHQELLESIESSNVVMSESIGGIESVDNTELVEKVNEIITIIEPLTETMNYINVASSSLTTYAVFYVPLAMIVIMLWWFFKRWIR